MAVSSCNIMTEDGDFIELSLRGRSKRGEVSGPQRFAYRIVALLIATSSSLKTS